MTSLQFLLISGLQQLVTSYTLFCFGFFRMYFSLQKTILESLLDNLSSNHRLRLCCLKWNQKFSLETNQPLKIGNAGEITVLTSGSVWSIVDNSSSRINYQKFILSSANGWFIQIFEDFLISVCLFVFPSGMLEKLCKEVRFGNSSALPSSWVVFFSMQRSGRW